MGRSDLPVAFSSMDWDQEFTSGFAARYVGYKARQLIGMAGYTASDLADLRQDLALALWQRLPQFNPHRGRWNAFVVTIVDRQIATLLAARRARKRQHLLLRFDDKVKLFPWQRQAREEDFEEQVDLRLDLQCFSRRLPQILRVVWDWIIEDGSVGHLARVLCVSRQAIYLRRQELRRVFEAEFLGKSKRMPQNLLESPPRIPVGTKLKNARQSTTTTLSSSRAHP